MLAITVGLVAFAGVEWIRCDDDETRARSRRIVATFLVTLLAATGAAFALMYGFRRGYVHYFSEQPARTRLRARSHGHRGRRRDRAASPPPRIRTRVFRHRALMPSAIGVATVVFVWAYWLRPDSGPRPRIAAGQKLTKQLSAAITAWHGSRSLHWFSSYIGVVALAGAFAGFVVLARDARNGRRAATAVSLFVVPVALLYVARPSITPDQPWAMRRYLPVVIPGIAIALTAPRRAVVSRATPEVSSGSG